MTDIKTPLAAEPEKKPDSQAPVTKKTKAETSKAPKKEVKAESKPNKISKLAVVAIIIALGSTAGHYFWQQQQSQLLTANLSKKINSDNTATFKQYQTQIKQALNKQQEDFALQLQRVSNQVNDASQAKISSLQVTVSQLEQKMKQRQPSDWLLHEAEYLIRIAARTLWLEHDTTAAVGLLKDADARLADLNDPTLLPVRELVHLDIKSLELMPTLQTDEIVLSLMAMNKQVTTLPLAMVEINTNGNKEADLELSNDLNDWQTNLAKTWQKFIDDFIRVRQSTGLVEPLISPEQQQHLKQNLSLKVQLAIWAASERNSDVYQETLADIQLWLTEFFDLEQATNQHFLDGITKLQTQRVSYDYPSELSSLTAIRAALKSLTNSSQITPKESDSPAKKIQEIQQADEVKGEIESATPAIEKQDKQAQVEGSI